MMASDVMAPVTKRIRAYFAPVDRAGKRATVFDPARDGLFAIEAPPAPWLDLGWIDEFERVDGTVIGAVKGGSPANTQIQVRSEVESKVSLSFESWGKLQLSLSAGTQQMNLLAPQAGAVGAGSGGPAIAAASLLGGSTASSLVVDPAANATFRVGQLVAVDVDYTSTMTGYVGSGVSGAYVKAALNDVDYLRRVTLNVGRIKAIVNGALILEEALLAGAPVPSMKVSAVVGFCDREGSTFFQEWSALFVAEGQQGERVIWHYPRLQVMTGIAEQVVKSTGGYKGMRLKAAFRALPITDAVDGERVLCFRSYLMS